MKNSHAHAPVIYVDDEEVRTSCGPEPRKSPVRFTFTKADLSPAKLRQYQTGPRVAVWDAELKELGLELRDTGKRTFFVRLGRNSRKNLPPEVQYPPTDIKSVRDAARALLAKRPAPKVRMTMRVALERYLATMTTRKRKAATIRSYRAMFETRYKCTAQLLDKPLTSIDRSAVLHLHGQIRAEVQRRGDEEGARTADEVIAVLGRIFKTVLVTLPPAERFDNPVVAMTEGRHWNKLHVATEEDEPRPASETELKRIIDKLNNWQANPVFWAVSMVALMCGFRASRARTIKWEYVKDWLVFPKGTSKGKLSGFRFPITPQLREVIDQCRHYGSDIWLTPSADPTKPTNSDDWSDEHLLPDVHDKGTERMTAHNLRDSMITWVTNLTKDSLSGALLADHAVPIPKITLRYLNPDALKSAGAAQWHQHLADAGLKLRLR